MGNLNNIPQLRFPEFKEEWIIKKLGEVLSITSSSRVHKDEWTEEGVPFFRSSDIIAAFKNTSNEKAYIPFDLYETLSNKIGRVKEGDLLMTGGGSVGIPFLIKDNEPLYFKDADVLWLKNSDNINGYFLYCFFLSQSFREHLKSISHIGTIAHFTVSQAKNTPCYFPSLPEQTKIANFLTAIDSRIELLQKKKTQLEQYKKGIMQKLFNQEIRFKDDNGNDFPDWGKKRLGDLFNFLRGSSLSKNDITINGNKKCIHYGELFTIYKEQIKEVKSRTNIDGTKSKSGDILMPSSDVTPTGLATASVVLEDNIILGGDINILRPKTNIFPIFFSYLLNYNKAQIINLVTGTTVKHIYNKDVKLLTFNFPTAKNEQQKIANFLSAIDKKIKNAENQIDESIKYKQGLLQKMFV